MPDTPAISVLMAVHNGMPYLPATIESVLAQDLSDFELLAVDDGSTDETEDCLRGFADPRIRYHRLERVGFCEALNYGLAQARAALVARIDADDLACPGRLATQYNYMMEHPACVVLGCQTDEIDCQDRVIGKRTYPRSDTAIRWRMAFGCPFLHPGVMYRREAVRAAGGYRQETWPAEDYELWGRMADRGEFANHPDTLMKYRVRPQSVTTGRTEEQIELCSRVAAAYIERIAPGTSKAAAADLYHFLSNGREPKQTGYLALAQTYRQLKGEFLQRTNDVAEELEAEMGAVQRDLRWLCLDRAEQNWRNPWRAWSWLRLAGRFDPENGTIRRILGRQWRNLVSKARSRVRGDNRTWE